MDGDLRLDLASAEQFESLNRQAARRTDIRLEPPTNECQHADNRYFPAR